MSIILDARLKAAASLVREDGYLCDVGTDHAYLPCALALSGKIKGGMAMDVNTGPLENANHTIAEYQLSDVICTRLSDGLDALEDAETEKITDVSICGMGGELIDTLISRAEWLKNAEKSLILQPMTNIPLLRRNLYAAGFAIDKEIPVVDKNHLYTVMQVHYTGKIQVIDELFAQAGKIPQSGCEQASDYLRIVSGRLKKAAMGIAKSENQKEEAERLSALADSVLCLCPEYVPVTVGDIYALIEEWAPFESQCEWDNSGLQTGSMGAPVKGIVVALDCTQDVIDYAIETRANLIITHHPMIFRPLKQVTDTSLTAKLIKNNISIICAHTNLDMAAGGVNDCLASCLELEDVTAVASEPFLRVGNLPKIMTADEFATYVKQKLHTVVCYTDKGKMVERVALCSGAGSDFCMDAVQLMADAYLTGEIKHNYFVDTPITLVAAGHYETERVVLPKIKEKILKKFASVPVQVFELPEMKSL